MSEAENQDTNHDIVIMAVGDIMLGDSPFSYGFGVHSMIRRHGPSFPFEHVASTLKKADLAIGNLEAVVSGFNERADPFRSIQYRGQPESIDGLKQAGFKVVSAATNHTMQHGRSAVEETIGLLEKAGIRYTGFDVLERSITNACEIEVKGRKLGFLNYNLRPRQYFVDPPLWKESTVESMLAETRRLESRVDTVIVCMHWGDEFIEYPSPEQVKLGHDLIDAGADIILGHHPHILQGVQRYKHGVIAYSLGNFVFDLWQERLRRSVILKLILWRAGGIAMEFIPVMINSKHQPEILSGDRAKTAVKDIERLADNISDDSSGREAYRTKVEQETRRYRRQVNWFYLTHLHRYNPRLFFGNLLNSIKRRLGHK